MSIMICWRDTFLGDLEEEEEEEEVVVVVVKRTGMGSSWSFACTYCFERAGMVVSEWLIEDRQGVHAIHILLLLFFFCKYLYQ